MRTIMVKFGFKKIRIGILSWLLSGCGSTDLLTQYLTIEMMGVFKVPASAAGNYEPKYQSYLLKGVTGTLSTGETESLVEGASTALRIVGRPQIIAKVKIGDYSGKTFSSLRVTFDTQVIGAGRHKDDHILTLNSPDLDLNQAFTIESSKSALVTIKVKWANTVAEDTSTSPISETMTAPDFEMSVEGY